MVFGPTFLSLVSAKPVEAKFLPSDSILSFMQAERYTCLLVKKIAFMSSTEMIIPFRIIFSRLRHEKNVFYGINFCDVGILWKKCGIYFCDPNVLTNFVLASLKKKIQYIWE